MSRSEYKLEYHGEKVALEQLIQQFLSVQGFKLTEKKGEQYYKAGDAVMGYKGFKYSIVEGAVVINAWILGIKEFALENAGLNILANTYKQDINGLLQEIEKVNQGMATTDYSVQQQNVSQQNLQNDNPNANGSYIQNLGAETQRKAETMAEVAFWISLVALLISCCGVVPGGILIFVDIALAIQGLKTRKKGKAIATLVMSGLSALLLIGYIVFRAMSM